MRFNASTKEKTFTLHDNVEAMELIEMLMNIFGDDWQGVKIIVEPPFQYVTDSADGYSV